MSYHINATKDEIAETVLLAGDPLRAEFMALNFLEDPHCYNTVRNMLGYTGVIPSSGKTVSIQGSGMGMPSLSIYVNELIKDYGVKRIIRIGSAGSLKEDIWCRSIVLAQGSCSDSALNNRRFDGMTFAPIADWKLLLKAYKISQEMNLKVRVGNIFATDEFYDEMDSWKIFAQYGVLAVEMESAELYTLAAKNSIQALSILTISNNLVTGEKLGQDEIEKGFINMTRLALSL